MTSYPLLDRINSPGELRDLKRQELPQLANELRDFIVQSVASTGGHFSSNLGTIELTIALHYVFNTPFDRLVWDVGHQTYPHKILTGRRAGMAKLRQRGGIAGFPRRDESEYDTFGVAHSSTSISAALGMAVAAKRAGHPGVDSRECKPTTWTAVSSRRHQEGKGLFIGRSGPDSLPWARQIRPRRWHRSQASDSAYLLADLRRVALRHG
jgi:1-deoxy-D-xylulose-5-phosphate synthase